MKAVSHVTQKFGNKKCQEKNIQESKENKKRVKLTKLDVTQVHRKKERAQCRMGYLGLYHIRDLFPQVL